MPLSEVGKAWRRQQRKAWRKARWCLLALALGGSAYAFTAPDDARPWGDLHYLGFVLLFAGIVGIVFTLLMHYRCPECGKLVGSATGGIDLAPRECSHCGVSFL